MIAKNRLYQLGALLGIAAIFGVLPAVIGLQIEQRFRAAVADLCAQSSAATLEVTRFERGWFSSSAEVAFRSQEGQPPLKIEQRFRHGPILSAYPFIGLLSAESEARFDPSLATENTAFKNGLIATGSAGVTLLGTLFAKGLLLAPENKTDVVNWEPLDVSLSYSLIGKEIEAKAFWPRLKAGSELAFEEAVFEIKGILAENSPFEGRIDATFKNLRTPLLKAENLHLSAQGNTRQNAIESLLELSAQKFSHAQWGRFDKPSVAFALSHPDRRQFAALIKELAALQYDADTTLQIMEKLIALGDSGAVLNLDVHLEQAGKPLDFNASLSTIKEALYLPQNPLSLLFKLKIDAQVAARPETLSRLYPDLDGQRVELMRSQGYFAPQSDGRSLLTIKSERGNWLIGGKPLALLMMQMR